MSTPVSRGRARLLLVLSLIGASLTVPVGSASAAADITTVTTSFDTLVFTGTGLDELTELSLELLLPSGVPSDPVTVSPDGSPDPALDPLVTIGQWDPTRISITAPDVWATSGRTLRAASSNGTEVWRHDGQGPFPFIPSPTDPLVSVTSIDGLFNAVEINGQGFDKILSLQIHVGDGITETSAFGVTRSGVPGFPSKVWDWSPNHIYFEVGGVFDSTVRYVHRANDSILGVTFTPPSPVYVLQPQPPVSVTAVPNGISIGFWSNQFSVADLGPETGPTTEVPVGTSGGLTVTSVPGQGQVLTQDNAGWDVTGRWVHALRNPLLDLDVRFDPPLFVPSAVEIPTITSATAPVERTLVLSGRFLDRFAEIGVEMVSPQGVPIGSFTVAPGGSTDPVWASAVTVDEWSATTIRFRILDPAFYDTLGNRVGRIFDPSTGDTLIATPGLGVYEDLDDLNGNDIDDNVEFKGGIVDFAAGTFGSIVARNGLEVQVSQVPAPLGVRIVVDPGIGFALFRICNYDLQVDAGSSIVVTCGSIRAQVESGSGRVVLTGGPTVELDAGDDAKVSGTTTTGFVVENLGTQPLALVSAAGTTVEVPGGATVSTNDSTPPVVTERITGVPGDAGWYRSDVIVDWTVVDPESAVSSSPCESTTLTVDSSATELSCVATSGGGTTTRTITVQRDATPPTLAFTPSQSSYTIDQTVSVPCTASDATSGIAVGCAPVTGPATGFVVGPNIVGTSARDVAGNVATTSATFTVRVTATSLCNLTGSYVRNSSSYLQLRPSQRTAVDRMITSTCQLVSAITPGLTPRQRTTAISLFRASIDALFRGGWLTTAQSTALKGYAASI